MYRDVPSKQTQTSDQKTQDEKLAKQIQQKFDEEFAKRENEKATRKTNRPGAFQSVDDGNGFSQEVARAEKRFVNDSSRSTNTTIQPDNMFQRSNLLYEIKNTPIKLNPVVDDYSVDPVAEAVAADTIDNPSVYCEICGGRYKKGTKKAPKKGTKAPKVKGGYYVDPQTGEVVQVAPPSDVPPPSSAPSNPYSGLADNLVSSMNNALNFGSTTGGAKKKTAVANDEEEDVFRPGGETMNFFLKKTTRGSKHELYHYSATLRYYRRPLVIRRSGVEITINYKMFVTRVDLPPSMQAMVDAKKEVAKMKAKKSVDKEKKQAKKLADKEKKQAKKLAEKEKKEAKKLAEKEKKEAKKLAEKEKKEAKKLKALEKKEAKKAKKTTEKKPKKTAEKKAKKPAEKKAKKPATKKTTEKKAKKTGTKKAPKMTGGACGSCSMFY